MDTCRACGATLSGDIPWCGQCFTPVEAKGPKQERLVRELHAREAVAPAAAPTAVADRGNVVVVPEAERPSIVRAGPTTFGIVGRLVITAVLVGLGVGAFLFLEDWRAEADELVAFELFFLGAYAILAAVILVFTWRVERRPATVRLPETTVQRVTTPPGRGATE